MLREELSIREFCLSVVNPRYLTTIYSLADRIYFLYCRHFKYIFIHYVIIEFDLNQKGKQIIYAFYALFDKLNASSNLYRFIMNNVIELLGLYIYIANHTDGKFKIRR